MRQALVVIVVFVAVAGVVLWWFAGSEARSLASQIEAWTSYQSDRTIEVGAGACGDSSFGKTLQQLNAGQRYVRRFERLTFVVTPNPESWDQATFIGFNEDPTAICAVGGIYPFRAYPDHLLWRGVCGTGAGSDEDEIKRCRALYQLSERI